MERPNSVLYSHSVQWHNCLLKVEKEIKYENFRKIETKRNGLHSNKVGVPA